MANMWFGTLKSSIEASKELTQGMEDSSFYATQSMLYDRSASEALKYGEAQAALIRKKGKAVGSAALVDYVASGVVSTSGSAALVIDEIAKNSESDAMAVALEGRKAAINAKLNSKLAKMASRFALAQGLTNAALSAYSFGGAGAASVGRVG